MQLPLPGLGSRLEPRRNGNQRTTRLLALALLVFVGNTAYAESGDWLFRVGANNVSPKSTNHDIVEVDSATMVTFNATYFVTHNWAVELLAALPFEHDIDLRSGGQVAKTKHLPPTLSVQYHFTPDSSVRPYVGAGVNYTLFFEESTQGALDGSRLSLDDSVGAAAQVGIDITLSERWFLNAEVRWMDIDTKATLNGASLGNVEIDPWTYGLNLGFRL